MDHFEMTEKLREKAQVSYEEAKEALELNDWDMLEAIVYLEREGKTAQHTAQDKQDAKVEKKTAERKERVAGNVFETLTAGLTQLIEKGNRNKLEIYREGKMLSKLPLTVVVILTLCAFWFVVPAVVIALIAGCSFRLSGQDIDKDHSNGEVV